MIIKAMGRRQRCRPGTLGDLRFGDSACAPRAWRSRLVWPYACYPEGPQVSGVRVGPQGRRVSDAQQPNGRRRPNAVRRTGEMSAAEQPLCSWAGHRPAFLLPGPDPGCLPGGRRDRPGRRCLRMVLYSSIQRIGLPFALARCASRPG